MPSVFGNDGRKWKIRDVQVRRVRRRKKGREGPRPLLLSLLPRLLRLSSRPLVADEVSVPIEELESGWTGSTEYCEDGKVVQLNDEKLKDLRRRSMNQMNLMNVTSELIL